MRSGDYESAKLPELAYARAFHVSKTVLLGKVAYSMQVSVKLCIFVYHAMKTLQQKCRENSSAKKRGTAWWGWYLFGIYRSQAFLWLRCFSASGDLWDSHVFPRCIRYLLTSQLYVESSFLGIAVKKKSPRQSESLDCDYR